VRRLLGLAERRQDGQGKKYEEEHG
jgi:hypothetical protein